MSKRDSFLTGRAEDRTIIRPRYVILRLVTTNKSEKKDEWIGMNPTAYTSTGVEVTSSGIFAGDPPPSLLSCD